MRLKFTVLCILLSAPIFAQNQTLARGDIWIAPVAEANFYSISDLAFGGGIAFGYGDGVSIGFKAVFFTDMDKVNSLELNFLLRLYLPRLEGHSGLFVQFSGGPVLFTQIGDNFDIPAQVGTFSAGVSVGWRFLFGNYFFLEPIVRAGYPYYAGAGLNIGVRF
jgi:hypothetical protein